MHERKEMREEQSEQTNHTFLRDNVTPSNNDPTTKCFSIFFHRNNNKNLPLCRD